MIKIDLRLTFAALLALVSLPVSATIVEYDMVFSDTVTPGVTGGSGVLTVDLPASAGSEQCTTVFGCDSPPAFSVLVSFTGTVNGVTYSSSDLLKVVQNQTISWSTSNLVSGSFNIIKTATNVTARVEFSLSNGSGTGTWDWVFPSDVLSGEGTISIARASVPEPLTLALMGLGIAGIGYSRNRGRRPT